jgi:hypothetical protein
VEDRLNFLLGGRTCREREVINVGVKFDKWVSQLKFVKVFNTIDLDPSSGEPTSSDDASFGMESRCELSPVGYVPRGSVPSEGEGKEFFNKPCARRFFFEQLVIEVLIKALRVDQNGRRC